MVDKEFTDVQKEHIFTVDFEFIKKKASKIYPELYKDEVLSAVKRYSNDKNELRLLTIIDFSNELATIKNQLWGEELDISEEEVDISRDSCQQIIQYLSDFASNEMNGVGNESKEEKDEVVAIDKNEIVAKSLVEKASNEFEAIERENELKTVPEDSKNDSNISSKALERKFEEQNDHLVNHFKKHIQELPDAISIKFKKEVHDYINKSESDKKQIVNLFEGYLKTNKSEHDEQMKIIKDNVTLLTETMNKFTENHKDIIVGTISSNMEKALNEHKINFELEAEDKKIIKGIKPMILMNGFCVLVMIFLSFFAAKWYQNSAKYENIIKVQSNLPPYEAELFNQIITKGYANTRDNPRNNINN